MPTDAKLMTADELLAMPDDGARRYELVRGELIEMSPAGFDHGVIGGRLARHLAHHVYTHDLGEVPASDTGYLVTRDPDTVRQPDASFVSAERVIRTRTYFPGAPDLAVEVISPTDSYREVRAKVREYLAAGARMVIVIDPDDRTATVTTPERTLDLTIEDTIEGADVVPGWSLPLRELFA